jgi:hypothetical protein
MKDANSKRAHATKPASNTQANFQLTLAASSVIFSGLYEIRSHPPGMTVIQQSEEGGGRGIAKASRRREIQPLHSIIVTPTS